MMTTVPNQTTPATRRPRFIFLLLIACTLGSNAFSQTNQTQIVPPSNSGNVTETNISYGLVIDDSSSMRRQLEDVIAAGKLIINANRPGDETFITRFVDSDKVTTAQTLTKDKKLLAATLDDLFIEAGSPARLDALYLSVGYLDENVAKPNDRRQALILMTSGDEDKSYYKLDDVLKLLHGKKLPIYILIVADNASKDADAKTTAPAMKLLETLAKETGGKVYAPKSQADWQSNLRELSEAIRKP